MHDIDWDSMSFGDYVELREEVSRQMLRRFRQDVAVAFTDVVGSTVYFKRHGNVAGQALLHRHHQLVERAIAAHGGRIVDTAGDATFCVFDSAPAGVRALMAFQELVTQDNANVPVQEQLSVRTGLHYGPALVGEHQVRGDSVNFTSRVAGGAKGGEIRLSRDAFETLPSDLRARCQSLGELSLKGIEAPAEVFVLDWRDPRRFPNRASIVETGEVLWIPCQDRVTLGRIAEFEGQRANDIVLALEDADETRRISRWHLALELRASGLTVRALTSAPTEVDGRALPEGASAPLRSGSEVRLSNVMTLRFLSMEPGDDAARTVR